MNPSDDLVIEDEAPATAVTDSEIAATIGIAWRATVEAAAD